MRATLRYATHGDAEDVVRLWRALQFEQGALDEHFKLAPDAEARWRNDYREWVEAEVRCIVVAEIQERLVGFASAGLWRPAFVYEQELECYVDEIFVSRDVRRRGIGSDLVSAIGAWANRHGAERLRLGVLAENQSGIEFWTRLGARPFTVTMLLETQENTAAGPNPV
jgi:GNAT superfamily N-acetyltransferase